MFCSTDFSCKFQFRKFHKFCERKFNGIMKHLTKLIKLSKLKFIDLSAFHVDCSYKPTSVQLSAVHTSLACTRLYVAMELSKTMMTTTIGLYYARIRSPVGRGPCLLWPRLPILATVNELPPRSLAFPCDDLFFSEEVILDKLNNLKVSKSPGPDSLHPRIETSNSNTFM